MAKTDSTPQNFHQWLQNMIPQLAQGMACPDSTIRFCQQLTMIVAGKLKQHGQQQGAAAGVGGAQGGPSGIGGPGGPPKPPGLQMPGGPAGGGAANPMMPNLSAPNMPGGGPGGPGGGAPGIMSGAGNQTPDELRRVIAATAGS